MSQQREGAGTWCGLLLVALIGFPIALNLGAQTEQSASARSWGEQQLTILHTNDIHGQVLPRRTGLKGERGGLLALGRTIRAEREAALMAGRPVLLLDGGDFFQGTLEGDHSKGAVVVDWMNELRYDAVVVGNHEFDFGSEVMVELARRAEFPFLGANVRSQATGQVPAWLGQAREEPLDGRAIVREVGDLRVAVIGLTTSHMDQLVAKGKTDGLEFLPEIQTLERLLDRVADADLRILLTHCGLDTDRALAERFQSQIDVIVGGHSHTRLEKGEQVGRVLIAQTGSRSQRLGRIDLRVTPAPRPGERPRVEASAKLIGTADRIQAALDPYLETAERSARREIVELGREGLSHRVAEGRYSSPLGTLVADSLCAEGEAEVGFHNRYGTRASLPPGRVHYRDLYEALPFDNRLVTLELTGAQLQKLLGDSLDGESTPLEISGLKVSFNPKNPKGKRLLQIQVQNEPLDPLRAYRVATHDYLADGKDGHVAFLEATKRKDHELRVRDVVERYLETREGYVAPTYERWEASGTAPEQR